MLGKKDVSNAGVVGRLVGIGLLDGLGWGLVGLGLRLCGDVGKGLLDGRGLGLIGCLAGVADWNDPPPIGRPLEPPKLPPPKPSRELPKAGRPLPPELPNALPCLGGGLENPLNLLDFPPLMAPIAFPSLPPVVPSQPGTSHGQLQIKLTSSKAKPKGHLNS